MSSGPLSRNKFLLAGIRALVWAAIMFVNMFLGSIYERQSYSQEQRMTIALAWAATVAVLTFGIVYVFAFLRESLKEKGEGTFYQSVRAVGSLCAIIISLSTVLKLFSLDELTNIENWTENRELALAVRCYSAGGQQDALKKSAGLTDSQISSYKYDYCSCFVKAVKGRFGFGEYMRDEPRAINILNANASLPVCAVLASNKFTPAQKARLRIQADIENVRKTLPLAVDEETRMDGIELGEGQQTIFRYTLIKYKASEIGDLAAVKRSMFEAVRPIACLRLKTQIESGDSFAYNYVGNDRQPILSFVIDKNSCSSSHE